jgi:hypothetical protein
MPFWTNLATLFTAVVIAVNVSAGSDCAKLTPSFVHSTVSNIDGVVPETADTLTMTDRPEPCGVCT